MSSALSITRGANPPRAVYLDYPLGHTAGKANDRVNQRRVMLDTLNALESIQQPGTIRTLPYRWASDDSWKDGVMRADPDGAMNDSRVERFDTPQYQHPDDQPPAASECATCVFLADRRA